MTALSDAHALGGLALPNLTEPNRRDAPLDAPDRATADGEGPRGCADYPPPAA